MSPNRNVLITGAAGFVGSCLARRLLQLGYTVHVLLKGSTDRWRLSDIIEHVQVYDVDLLDYEKLKATLFFINPDIIYHLATRGAYPDQNNSNDMFQTNVVGTWNLLRASSICGCELFVNTGSSSEYGFKNSPMKEIDSLETNSYYSATKSSQTLLCRQVSLSEDRPITTLRLFSVYGPTEEITRLVPTVLLRCLRGEDLELVSADVARDFIYIDDVVDAYLSIDKLKPLRGEVINIASGAQTTIGQVAQKAIEITDAKVKCLFGTKQPRIWDAKTWVADVSKSQSILGKYCKTSLSDGLIATKNWITYHGLEVFSG